MKKIFLYSLFAFVFSHAAFSCGEYLVRAQVTMKNGISGFVINPGSKSEINLRPEFNESAKLSPYIDHMIEAKVRIDEQMDFTVGKVALIEDVKIIAPDPLAPGKGTKLTVLKKVECKKKTL